MSIISIGLGIIRELGWSVFGLSWRYLIDSIERVLDCTEHISFSPVKQSYKLLANTTCFLPLCSETCLSVYPRSVIKTTMSKETTVWQKQQQKQTQLFDKVNESVTTWIYATNNNSSTKIHASSFARELHYSRLTPRPHRVPSSAAQCKNGK